MALIWIGPGFLGTGIESGSGVWGEKFWVRKKAWQKWVPFRARISHLPGKVNFARGVGNPKG